MQGCEHPLPRSRRPANGGHRRRSGSTISTNSMRPTPGHPPSTLPASSPAAAANAAPVGTTTSAVIAALAMDAALPHLDPTAMALLETIMTGGAAAAAAAAGGSRRPAPAPAALPYTPTAAKSATASPLTAATTVLTQQALQQHDRQWSQQAQRPRQQSPHRHYLQAPPGSAREQASQASLAVAGTDGVVASPFRTGDSGAGASQRGSKARTPRQQQQHNALYPRQGLAPSRPQSPPHQVAAGFVGGDATPGRTRPPLASPKPHRDRQQLPEQPPLESPSAARVALHPPLSAEGSAAGTDMGSSSTVLAGGGASSLGGEESLQARTGRLLGARGSEGDSPPAVTPRRPAPASHSAASMQHQLATAALSPSSPGSRTLIKRLCRSHAAGSSLAAGSPSNRTMMRSPKDDQRRPMTYAELQITSKLHHQHDPPSSPHQQSLAGEPNRSLTSVISSPAAPTAAAIITTADGGGIPNDAKAAADCADARSSHSSGRSADADRLSGRSSATAAAGRPSPYSRPTPGSGRLHGGLMVPETICERGSTSMASEARTPTIGASTQMRQQQTPLQTQQEEQQQQQTPVKTHAGVGVQQQRKAPAAKRGLFGGLFACFGFGGAAVTSTEAVETVQDDEEARQQQTTVGISREKAPAAAPSEALDQRKVAVPTATPPRQDPIDGAASVAAPTSTVAAVAAALSMSPTAAAAHVQADSKLLLLLRAELGEGASDAAAASAKGEAAPPTPTSGAAADAWAVKRAGTDGVGSLPCTPGRNADGTAAAQAVGTSPAAAMHWPSKSPLPPGSAGNRQPPVMMPASPDGLPVDATIIVTRSPVGHLRHEDGDSVLRGSVDVHPSSAAASCVSFSPAAAARPHQPAPVSRACSSALQPGGGALPRAPRQPLQTALEAAAGPASGGGKAYLEPTEAGGRSPRAAQTPPNHSPLDLSLRSHHGADAAAPSSPAPGRPLGGGGATPLQPPRSSRKRSRATHACGGGALSQLDARKLAAMPLEEMLEQIQAAIAAEDLATGRTARIGTSGGGLSGDDGNILPMPPVMAKARSGGLRRRKSVAGGGSGRGNGLHSGGGGGGGPSRGGRSSDGGTRGGSTGVGAVHTTLMKAAAATAASIGGNSGRRRRRVRGNRTPPLSNRRKPPQVVPPPSTGSLAEPVSPNAHRKSDGASSYGQQPVWRHGGRALAFNGFGIGGIPSSGGVPTTTSPRSGAHDNCFSRQPPYKKPQLCTPTAATAPTSAGGFAAASVLNGGGVSPPRLRQSAPGPAAQYMAALPPIAASKTPMPAKTPAGVVHTHVRTARRLLDADDSVAAAPAAAAAAQRPMGYAAALLAASFAGKVATPPAGKKVAAAATTTITTAVTSPRGPGATSPRAPITTSPRGPTTTSPRGPMTTSVNISDLLTRYGIPTIPPIKAMPVTTTFKVVPSASAGGAPPANATERQREQAASAGGAVVPPPPPPMSTAAAVIVVPSIDAVLRPENRDGEATHGSPPPKLPTDGDASSNELTPQKPRIVSVSLSELLMRASSVPQEQRLSGSAGGMGDISPRAEPEAAQAAPREVEDEQQQQQEPLSSVGGAPPDFVGEAAADAAAEAAAVDTDVSGAPDAGLIASTSQKILDATSPRAAAGGRRSSTGGTAGGSETLSRERHQEGGEGRELAPRSPVGYLELMQAHGTAGGSGRASATAVPHYAMPIASRGTSAGGNGAGGGSSGGGAARMSVEGGALVAAGAMDSPARALSPAGRPSAGAGGGIRQSLQSIGSYAQIAAQRSSGTAAAGRVSATAVAVAPASPAAACGAIVTTVAASGGGDLADAGTTHAFALPDAASASGSPTLGPVAARGGLSPATSSVVAQLPSGDDKAAEREGLASTAAVRSGGVRLLEDTADSGGAAANGGTGADDRAGGKLLASNDSNGRQQTGDAEPEEAAAVPGALVAAHGSGGLGEARASVQDDAQQDVAPAVPIEEGLPSGDSGVGAAAAELLQLQSSGSQPPVKTARSSLTERQAAAAGSEELLQLQSSGSQPPVKTARSSLTERQAAAVMAAAAAVVPPHQVALPLTPQPSVTPFADWRCVPLAAYEASLVKDFEALLAAPTESERLADDDGREVRAS
ncbi:hypothetical protein PLESTB_000695600 [Pleodorina starrii]|uniref:Uncharacterized protein n=1 Tax=Pleodorina starrii TaxID=330485 RepID=A0A9W6BJJ8_9CHLO|nr:hypothetical protein PLESTB_000695600 [Pleodorina starrii]